MRPKWEYGAEVRVLRDLRNDGSFPGQPTGALLVPRGSLGFVRDIGTFLQDQVIYAVHLLDTNRVVGCRETELQAAAEPWVMGRFEPRERVAARLALGSQGRVLVERGEVGEVARVIAGGGGAIYYVSFPGRRLLQVPEDALDALGSEEAA